MFLIALATSIAHGAIQSKNSNRTIVKWFEFGTTEQITQDLDGVDVTKFDRQNQRGMSAWIQLIFLLIELSFNFAFDNP